jgi:membrane protein DedA with SNARE-associated domain
MEPLITWLLQYGYAGLFTLLMLGIAGLPIPDETLLVISGYLISAGRLHPAWTFLSGFAGASSGISLSYWLGRALGHKAVGRYGKYIHLTPARVDAVQRWFGKIGNWLLSVGYFIPGVRHFTALVAGMSGISFRVFAPYAYSGAAIWVLSFLAVGYAVGENWRAALLLIHRYTWGVILLLMVTGGVFWWVRTRRPGSSMTK